MKLFSIGFYGFKIELLQSMNALTLVLITFLSFSVYAKTEAGINQIGFKSKKQARTIANTAEGLQALSQLSNMNQQSNRPVQKYESTYAGFAGSEGALTKSRTPANKKKNKTKIIK